MSRVAAALNRAHFESHVLWIINSRKSPEATIHDLTEGLNNELNWFYSEEGAEAMGIADITHEYIAKTIKDEIHRIVLAMLITMWEDEHDQDRTILTLKRRIGMQASFVQSLQSDVDELRTQLGNAHEQIEAQKKHIEGLVQHNIEANHE